MHGRTGGGGGADDSGGGGGGGGVVFVSMICQSASFPLPSSVMILPPYFINGIPLSVGHPFRTVPSALKHVEVFATYVSVSAVRETLRYMVMPG